MRRIALLAAVTAVIATVVVAIATDKPPWASTDRNGRTTIHVKGGEFWFKLSAKSAPRGTVTFVFKNVGMVAHDLKINGEKTPPVQPGKTFKLVVKFTKAGKYPYSCTIPGHAAAGMKGTFTIR
jgi:uncharacterized cupredoxin-like copper-binding protein